VTGDARRRSEQRFTATARDFAESRALRDLAQLESLLRLIAPAARDALLDVACGPGRLLATFAPRVRIAAGVDLTMEMLKVAREQPQAGAAVGLVRGEGEHLPFPDQAFTIVTTTLAIHHYGDPPRVLEEMARVCRQGGKVAVGDIVGAEDDARRARQNEIERLRDPSHVQVFSASGLQAMLKSIGLVPLGRASGTIIRELNEWCRIARTPPAAAALVRKMLLESREEDGAGMQPVLHEGELRFNHHWLNLVCRRV
jgi:SAM-dependent methyltransferase